MPTDEILVEQATTASYRLEDLDVKEVSAVDRAANKRKFLVVKNAEVEMPQNTPNPEGEVKSDPVVAAQADKAKDSTELIVSLPESVRDETAEMLTSLSKRIAVLGEAVKAAEPGEGGVSDKFKNEVIGLSSVLRRLGGLEKAGKPNELDKAALADGADIDVHAGLAPMPKTASVEYVMTSEGPLMKMPPEDMMKVALRYAQEQLYCAEDTLMYDGDFAGCCICLYNCMKALGPFIPQDGGMPQQVAMAVQSMLGKQYAFNQPQPSIAAGVPDSHPPVGMEKPGSGVSDGNLAKGHKQFTPERMSKLTAMFAELEALLSEVKVEDDTSAAPAPVAKSEIPDEFKAVVSKMAGKIKSLESENKSLRSSRPLGNAIVATDSAPNPSKGKVTWPDDLNELDDSDLE